MSALRRTQLLGLIAAGALALGLVGASSPAPARQAPKPKIVTVGDFYFAPAAVTIRRGGAVRWVWSAANSEPHDVHLKRGPKGLTRKGSYSTRTTAVTNARFQKTFPRAGTYKYVCTLHAQMKMTLTVKR